jgi:molybdopterin/thiamine biosynthesis adenylyltransferase
MTCFVTLPDRLYEVLNTHLFPGDGDEHGAVLAVGSATTARGVRLLAREVFLAVDGVDYVPGQRGYRMLTAEFVRDRIRYCRDQALGYVAVHNHGAGDSVAFSGQDLASHERGYPALLDIARGQPVGALVFATNAVAGDIWFRDGRRSALTEARVLGQNLLRLAPTKAHSIASSTSGAFDRQARLLGDEGQALLRQTKVGVIGAGGVGSLVVEYLARLGVGHLVVVDPERLDVTNLSRVVGSNLLDTLSWLTREGRPKWLRNLGGRLTTKKVDVCRRVARQAPGKLEFEGIFGDFVDDAVATRFRDCDFLFLAADSMQARLVFNALVHQYLIPGVQLGSKVPVDKASGRVGQVFSVARPVTPDLGCLWCNGVISASRLQNEAVTSAERRAWAYVDDPTVIAPSVITLNAVASSEAVNDFLFWLVGLRQENARRGYTRHLPRTRDIRLEEPRADAGCRECGLSHDSRLGRGDGASLPTRSR